MSMTAIWLVAAAVFLVIEVVTVSMCSIWFMVGALAAAAAAALHTAIWHQLILFVLLSAICFVLLYPRLRRLMNRTRQATNADMVIGQTCAVTQRIDNIGGTGAVSIAGKTWTARTEDGSTVEEGVIVRVSRIDGVKLIVTPARETAAIS